jgi:uncharacterized protein YciI
VYFLLLYDLVDDYMQRRPPLRPEHLALAERAQRDGKLFMAGALNPPEGAIFVWKGDGPGDAEAFARADPYVKNGLVKSWRVREWKVVIGGEGK